MSEIIYDLKGSVYELVISDDYTITIRYFGVFDHEFKKEWKIKRDVITFVKLKIGKDESKKSKLTFDVSFKKYHIKEYFIDVEATENNNNSLEAIYKYFKGITSELHNSQRVIGNVDNLDSKYIDKTHETIAQQELPPNIMYKFDSENDTLLVSNDGTLIFQHFGSKHKKLKKEIIINRNDVVYLSIPEGGFEGYNSLLEIDTREKIYSICISPQQFHDLEAVYYYLSSKHNKLLNTDELRELKLKTGVDTLIPPNPTITVEPNNESESKIVYNFKDSLRQMLIADDGRITIREFGLFKNTISEQNVYTRDDFDSVFLKKGEPGSFITLTLNTRERIIFFNEPASVCSSLEAIAYYLKNKDSKLLNLAEFYKMKKELNIDTHYEPSMSKEFRNSINNELNDIKEMYYCVAGMTGQMSLMCVEIATMKDTINMDCSQSDVEFIAREIDRVEEASKLQKDMCDYLFDYYDPLGFWKMSLESMTEIEFRKFHYNIGKNYNKIKDIYFRFYNVYAELSRRRLVPSKPRLESVEQQRKRQEMLQSLR